MEKISPRKLRWMQKQQEKVEEFRKKHETEYAVRGIFSTNRYCEIEPFLWNNYLAGYMQQKKNDTKYIFQAFTWYENVEKVRDILIQYGAESIEILTDENGPIPYLFK